MGVSQFAFQQTDLHIYIYIAKLPRQEKSLLQACLHTRIPDKIPPLTCACHHLHMITNDYECLPLLATAYGRLQMRITSRSTQTLFKLKFSSILFRFAPFFAPCFFCRRPPKNTKPEISDLKAGISARNKQIKTIFQNLLPSFENSSTILALSSSLERREPTRYYSGICYCTTPLIEPQHI